MNLWISTCAVSLLLFAAAVMASAWRPRHSIAATEHASRYARRRALPRESIPASCSGDSIRTRFVCISVPLLLLSVPVLTLGSEPEATKRVRIPVVSADTTSQAPSSRQALRSASTRTPEAASLVSASAPVGEADWAAQSPDGLLQAQLDLLGELESQGVLANHDVIVHDDGSLEVVVRADFDADSYPSGQGSESLEDSRRSEKRSGEDQ